MARRGVPRAAVVAAAVAVPALLLLLATALQGSRSTTALVAIDESGMRGPVSYANPCGLLPVRWCARAGRGADTAGRAGVRSI